MSPKVYDHQKTSVIVRRTKVGEENGIEDSEPNMVECPICGEMTVNNHHYGGVACDSCKAFFRRTVVNPSKKSEKCRIGNGKCTLKKERRNNCPFCRFQLCVQTGMKPDMIKIRRTLIKPAAIKETSQPERISPILRIELSEAEKIEQILFFHQFILTQTSGVNLMTIPAKFLNIVEERIRGAAGSQEKDDDILSIAQLELHFLKAKQHLLDNQSKNERLFKADNYPGQLFTETQEIILEMIIIFLKECKFFQALTWDCTSRLLRCSIEFVCHLITA